MVSGWRTRLKQLFTPPETPSSPAEKPIAPGPELWKSPRTGRIYQIVGDRLVDPLLRKENLQAWGAYDQQLRTINIQRMKENKAPLHSLAEARGEDPFTRRMKNY